jgi:hypothetical protein
VAKTQEDLLIKIQADTANASEAIALLAKQLGRLETSMVDVAKSSAQTSQKVSGFGAAMIAVSAGIAIAREAFNTFEGAVKSTVGGFQRSEDGAIRLAGTLAKMGSKDVRGAVEDFKRFAKTLQDTTTVEDDHAIALLNIATASGLSAEKSKQLIEVSADLAATGRGDLDSAFQALLKSYKGNVAGLAILAPELSGMEPVLAKTGEAVRRLQENLGGLAKNELFTSAGTMAQFKNTLGDLGEETGRLISNFLGLEGTSKVLTNSLKSIISVIKEMADNVPRAGEGVAKFSKAFSEINFGKMAAELGQFIDQFKILIGLFAGFSIAGTVIAFGGLGATIAALVGTAGFGMLAKVLIPVITYLGAATAAALSFTLALSGYAFAAAGILTLAAAIEIIVRNLTSLQGLADLLVAGFGGVVLVFANFAQGVINLGQGILELLGITTKAINFLGMFDGLAQKTADSVNRLNTGLTGTAISEVGTMLDKLKGGAVDAEKLGAALPKVGPKSAPLMSADDKKAMELRVKNFEDLRAQNAVLDLENRRSEMTTIDYLNQKNQLEIQALRLKFKAGELGALGTKELEKQIELMNIKNGIAVDKAPSPKFEQGQQAGEAAVSNLGKTLMSGAGKFGGVMQGAVGAMSGVASGLAGTANVYMAAVSALLSVVQGIIDFIPKILDAIAGIFNTAAELPMKIVSSAKGIVTSMVKFTSEFIPGLFQMIPDLIMTIIDGALVKLPAAGVAFMKSFPDMVMKLFARLPEIFETLIQGLIGSSVEISVAIVTGIIGNIPRIIVAIVKSLVMAVRGIWIGIIKGIQQIATAIGSMFGPNIFGKKKQKIDIDPKSLTETMKKAASVLTGETSKLFKVVDLGGEDSKAATKSQELIDQITAAGKTAKDWLAEAWQKILSGFGELMAWFGQVWHQLMASVKEVFNGIVQMFRDVFSAVKGIFDGIVTALSGAFDTLKDAGAKIAQGIQDGLAGAGAFFKDLGAQIWQGLWNGLQSLPAMFTNMLNSINPSNLFEKMFRVPPSPQGQVESALGINIPFMNFAKGGMVPGNAMVAGDSLMNDRVLAMISPGEAVVPRSKMNDPFLAGLVRGVLDGTITPPKFAGGFIGQVQGAVAGAGATVVSEADKAKAFIASLNPAQLWDMVRGKVMKEMIPEMLKANKFHEGGIIGGSGDVPILGQAGEFVMQRSAVSGIGQGNLAQMNRTGTSSAQGNTSNVYNIDIKVDAKTAPDEKFIRGTLLPILKEELRRASLDGQRVLFQQGIRA